MSGGRSRSGASAAASPFVLLVRSQKSRDFAAYETYEGARKHLVGLPSGVLKVVVWVSQHIKKSLNQFFILQGKTDRCKLYTSTHIFVVNN